MSKWNPHKYACSNCSDIIYSSYPGEFVTCKCFKNEVDNKGLFIDETEHYMRTNQHPNIIVGRLHDND